MAGWQDRAKDVTGEHVLSWRDRARDVTNVPHRKVQTGGESPDWATSVEYTPSDALTVSAPEAALAGATQGVTQGWADELAGAIEAPFDAAGVALRKAALLPPRTDSRNGATIDPETEPGLLQWYRQRRDQARSYDRRARDQHPVAHGAGEVAGDLATQTALGIVSGGASWTPAAQAGLGAFSGLGGTEAELTPDRATLGDLQQAGIASGVSAALAGGLTAAGAKATNAIRKRAARGVAEAVGDATSKATRAVEDRLASLRGSLGSEVQKGSRYLENVGREASKVNPELQAALATLTESGAPQSLREEVVKHTAENIPGQMSRIGSARDALTEATASRADDIAAQTADTLADPLKRQILPRLKTYASRTIPVTVGSAVGGMVGGLPGAALGSVVGTGLSAVLGRPGTALANAMKHPAVRKAAWESVERTLATQPERLGRFAAAFSRGVAPKAVDQALSNSPKYAAEWNALKAQLLDEQQHATPNPNPMDVDL